MPLPDSEAAGAQYGQNRTRKRDEHVRKPLSRPFSCLIWYFHLFRRRAGKAAETENPKLQTEDLGLNFIRRMNRLGIEPSVGSDVNSAETQRSMAHYAAFYVQSLYQFSEIDSRQIASASMQLWQPLHAAGSMFGASVMPGSSRVTGRTAANLPGMSPQTGTMAHRAPAAAALAASTPHEHNRAAQGANHSTGNNTTTSMVASSAHARKRPNDDGTGPPAWNTRAATKARAQRASGNVTRNN